MGSNSETCVGPKYENLRRPEAPGGPGAATTAAAGRDRLVLRDEGGADVAVELYVPGQRERVAAVMIARGDLGWLALRFLETSLRPVFPAQKKRPPGERGGLL